jgi:hypothetical protein
MNIFVTLCPLVQMRWAYYRKHFQKHYLELRLIKLVPSTFCKQVYSFNEF